MTDLAACQVLLGKLNANKSVTARQLKSALGRYYWDEYQSIKAQREYDLYNRTIVVAKLSRYIKLLRKADFMNARAERLHARTQRSPRYTRLSAKVESVYEDALETLREIELSDRSVGQFLDRRIDWDETSSRYSAEATKEGVPRLTHHKNAMIECVSEIPLVRDLKRNALERAIETPIAELLVQQPQPVPLTPDQEVILKRKLKELNRHRSFP